MLAVKDLAYIGSILIYIRFSSNVLHQSSSLINLRNAPQFLQDFEWTQYYWISFLPLSHPVSLSLAEGHVVSYDREAPFELRIQDPNSGPQEVGTLEAIRVKVLNLVSAAHISEYSLLTTSFWVNRVTQTICRTWKSNWPLRTICFSTTRTSSTRTASARCKKTRS